MEQRIQYFKVVPQATKLLMELEKYFDTTELDEKLRELVKIRASQINGCAFCLDMHTKDARALGETEQRIYSLNAWHEAPFFTEQERVALELAEHLTLVSEKRVPDDLYQRIRQHFDEKQYTDLVLAIGMINYWNRISIAMNAIPGHYASSKRPKVQ
ncbi:carboxymuconolactone decarboxylase family protein [Alicyclobacillus fodiniaquatilis]|uniref:Carboxymuconolactone decarboxylase family protein n=1 Tax=Alicyclobacillus fodiniaquatilis TaxID=1661150 RepID=A0ABW4JPE7_9BACL